METCIASIEGTVLFVVDPLLLNQLLFASVLKSDSNYVKLSKEEILVEEGTVLFIIPTQVASTHLAAYHIRKLKEKGNQIQFHILFCPGKSIMCSQCLREEKVLGDVTIHSASFNVIPLDEDIVSMEINNAFSRLYLKKDKSMSMQVMQLVCQIQEMSAGISEIHGIGDEAIHIMELLQKQKKLAHASPSGKLPVRHLILLDRSTDFTSLFVTPLTYEGLVDELLQIHCDTVTVSASTIGRRDEAPVSLRLSNDDDLFSELRDANICMLPAELQRKLYATQQESMQAASEGKTFSKADAFDQLQIHQGLSDAVTATTNGYLFRQQWQMEHEILAGENLLDYIVERVTLQDSLLRVTRFLCLFSLVNGGLRAKDFDTVRKELVQTYGYETLLFLRRLEAARLLVRRERDRNYSALRNKLQLVKDVSGENVAEMHYVTSGYAPVSAKLVERILGGEGVSADVARLVGCEYDHEVLQRPREEAKQAVVVFFVGGVTYMEIAALRFLAKKNNFPYELIIMTTNITSGNRVLNELQATEPLKLPPAEQSSNSYNPF